MLEADLFTLPQQYLALRDEARAVAQELAQHAAVADEAGAIDPVVLERLARSGLATVMVAGPYGGRFERVDSLAITVVREAFAEVSGHLDSVFAIQGLGSYPISAGGSASVQSEWLPRVASCQAIAALALTEPEVGSDLKAVTTRIVWDGDEVVVTGHKSFITNGGDADFYCVLGKDGDGYSMVLVPANRPGVTTSKPYQIIAPHVLGDIVFDEVRVPAGWVLGTRGRGFSLMLATLAVFRVTVAGAAVGLAQGALDAAVAHTLQREQFGRPVARLGSVAAALALSWTEIEMARSLTYRAAAAAARDPMAALNLSSMAKVGATEMAARVADRAVQAMGRFGLVRGGVVERLYREARPMRVYEGTTEVILDSPAKQLVKQAVVQN